MSSKEYYRNHNFKRNYGIDTEEYVTMFVSQQGVCAICKQPETFTIKGKVINLAVDHDHETGKVRSLLCRNCNLALGYFKDDVENLQEALRYLKNHNSNGLFIG